MEASIRAATDSDDEEEGVTFTCLACKDGRTRLHFGDKTKPEEAKRISKAFWKVLLAEPSELDDFSAETVDHSGAKVAYGVRDGAVSTVILMMPIWTCLQPWLRG